MWSRRIATPGCARSGCDLHPDPRRGSSTASRTDRRTPYEVDLVHLLRVYVPQARDKGSGGTVFNRFPAGRGRRALKMDAWVAAVAVDHALAAGTNSRHGSTGIVPGRSADLQPVPRCDGLPLLRRINTYMLRWARQKYQAATGVQETIAWWKEPRYDLIYSSIGAGRPSSWMAGYKGGDEDCRAGDLWGDPG